MSEIKSRMGMRNNVRKFRGSGPRPDRAEQKRADALARNAAWQALSPTEQLKVLDERFGKNCGATKQRIRLSMKLFGDIGHQILDKDLDPDAMQPKKEKKMRAKDRRAAGV